MKWIKSFLSQIQKNRLLETEVLLRSNMITPVRSCACMQQRFKTATKTNGLQTDAASLWRVGTTVLKCFNFMFLQTGKGASELKRFNEFQDASAHC